MFIHHFCDLRILRLSGFRVFEKDISRLSIMKTKTSTVSDKTMMIWDRNIKFSPVSVRHLFVSTDTMSFWNKHFYPSPGLNRVSYIARLRTLSGHCTNDGYKVYVNFRSYELYSEQLFVLRVVYIRLTCSLIYFLLLGAFVFDFSGHLYILTSLSVSLSPFNFSTIL